MGVELYIEDFEESDEELASTPDSEAAASESGNEERESRAAPSELS